MGERSGPIIGRVFFGARRPIPYDANGAGAVAEVAIDKAKGLCYTA